MAIGNKGFYATTQAPNVDFGAMVDRGIDKKLARDEAEEAKKANQEAAKAKAKADKVKDLKWDLNLEKTGRNVLDSSMRDTFLDMKRFAGDAKRNGNVDGFNAYMEEAQNLINYVDSFNKTSELVANNPDEFSPAFLERYNDFGRYYNKGDVQFAYKDGEMKYRTIERDANDKVINTSDFKSAAEVLGEPRRSFKYDEKATDFIADSLNLNVSRIDNGVVSYEKEKLTPEKLQLIKDYSSRVASDPSAIADWYTSDVANKGGYEGWSNRKNGEYTDEEKEEFRNYVEQDLINRVSEKDIKDVTLRDTNGSGGSRDDKPSPTDVTDAGGFSYKGYASDGSETTHFGNQYSVISEPLTEKNELIEFDYGGKKKAVSRFTYDPVNGKIGIVMTSADTISAGESDSGGETIKDENVTKNQRGSTSSRFSGKEEDDTLVFEGQKGWSAAKNAYESLNGKGSFEELEERMYDEMLQKDKKGYAKLTEMRGNRESAYKINSHKRKMVSKMKEKKGDYEKRFYKDQEAKREEDKEKANYKTYSTNKDLLDKLGFKNDETGFKSKYKTLEEIKEAAAKKLSYMEYVKKFNETPPSSTTQQTKSKKKRLPGT